jgi:large conductance mechanosensitive channel
VIERSTAPAPSACGVDATIRIDDQDGGFPVKSLLNEFKDFVNRGNLLELAIAVVLATAFAPVVTSIVDNIFMPIIAAIFGQPDFAELGIDIGDARINYGIPLTFIVSFLIIAFVCFLVVKAYNKMQQQGEAADNGPTEIELLTEIRDALRSR